MTLKLKKEIFRYSYLCLEKEEMDTICLESNQAIKELVEKEFREDYDIIFPSDPEKIQTTDDSSQQDIEEDNQEDRPSDIIAAENEDLKKLYRKIAIKTHPDKNNGDNTDKFIDAKDAYNNKDLAKLIQISEDIGIENLNLSSNAEYLIQEKNKQIEMDLEHKKNTVAWLWSQATSIEEKRKLIHFIIISLRGK